MSQQRRSHCLIFLSSFSGFFREVLVQLIQFLKWRKQNILSTASLILPDVNGDLITFENLLNSNVEERERERERGQRKKQKSAYIDSSRAVCRISLSFRGPKWIGLDSLTKFQFICLIIIIVTYDIKTNCLRYLVTVILEEDQINIPVCSPGAFIRQ